MRLFIAINFKSGIKSGLIALRNSLRSRSERGNFPRDENLHLTLAFIGETSPKKADAIMAAMDAVTFAPLAATVDRLGTFSRGTLWWAGLREDAPLMDLQREITHKLALSGFETDSRKYSPHITIGREVVTDAKPWNIAPLSETACAIDLMKSERTDGKLTYTAIFTRGAIDCYYKKDTPNYRASPR